MSEIPDDIMKAAEAVYAGLHANNYDADCDDRERDEDVAEIAAAIFAERERCADIADRMRIKHGSPVMGPYENGNWDQGKRIAALIRGEGA